MKLAVNQPYFLPYIGYFQLIASVDTFVFYGHLQYSSFSWMSRNRFCFNKEKGPTMIGLPVVGKKHGLKMLEMKISGKIDIWKRKKINQIKLGYGKAAYFEQVFPLCEDVILNTDYANLAGFNTQSAIKICQALNINSKLFFQDSTFDALEVEIADKFVEPNSTERKLYRIFKLCEYFDANVFHNLPGGAELYDKSLFAQQSVDLKFINLPDIIYPQFNNEFIPHLSIIDVLMHNGIEKTSELVHGYQLT